MNISVSNPFMMSQIVHPSHSMMLTWKEFRILWGWNSSVNLWEHLEQIDLKKKKKELLGLQEMRKLLKYGLSFKRVIK